MTEKICSLIDKYKKYYDDISVHIHSSKSKEVLLDGFKTEYTGYKDDRQMSVRLIKDGRQAACGFSGEDISQAENFISSHISSIDMLPSDSFRYMPAYSAVPDRDLLVFDKEFDNITINELLKRAEETTQSALDTDSRVKAVKQSTASASQICFTLVSTKGPVLKREKTVFSSGAYLIASDGSGETDGYDSMTSVYFDSVDHKLAGANAAREACRLIGAKPVKTGKYYIVFSPQVMADFTELLLDLTDGDSVYKGMSFLKDKIGSQAASEKLTLTDEPHLLHGVGSKLFDDEGQQCSDIEIFREGELCSYLTNSYTSKALNMKNTASGVIGSGGNLSTGVSNIQLASTSSSTADKECGEYLYITEAMGMHTADPVSGDFSVGISGLHCKRGSLPVPFREAVISGNLKHLLEGLSEVFSNRRTFGNITAADTLFDKMNISGE